jgi:hypothetical protein
LAESKLPALEFVQVADAMLKAGAAVDGVDYGRTTALMLCCWGDGAVSCCALIECMLRHGADAMLESAQGWSCFHILHHKRQLQQRRRQRIQQPRQQAVTFAQSTTDKSPTACFEAMEGLLWQHLKTKEAEGGVAYLRELDLDKPRDLSNREHLDNCGAHNRIPLEQREKVLGGRHDIKGIKAYIRSFKQEHGRLPKVCHNGPYHYT